MLEKTIKLAVKKRLKEIGAFQHWPVQVGMGDPCLDCHGCYQGIYFAIETKRPGGKLTNLQLFTVLNIFAAGGLVYVIDNLEDARALFSDNPPSLAKTTRAVRPRLRVVARRSDS
jgi:hypothetical protein